jgi:hypothetical protein
MREVIFKPTVGNENLYEIIDGSGIRVENFHFHRLITLVLIKDDSQI